MFCDKDPYLPRFLTSENLTGLNPTGHADYIRYVNKQTINLLKNYTIAFFIVIIVLLFTKHAELAKINLYVWAGSSVLYFLYNYYCANTLYTIELEKLQNINYGDWYAEYFNKV